MNSVFVNPGIYSCAVDAFLEISTHLFLPYLSNLGILIGMILQTCFSMFVHYNIEGNSRACLVIHHGRS